MAAIAARPKGADRGPRHVHQEPEEAGEPDRPDQAEQQRDGAERQRDDPGGAAPGKREKKPATRMVAKGSGALTRLKTRTS